MPQPRSSRSELPTGTPAPFDLQEVASDVLVRKLSSGTPDIFNPIPTGFGFDKHLGGGLHGGDLALLGGVQNVGKTAMIMQIAEAAASSGDTLVIVVCYEHDALSLWERMIIQQSYKVDPTAWTTSSALRSAYADILRERDEGSLQSNGSAPYYLNELIRRLPNGTAAWGRLAKIQQKVWLVTGDPHYTSLDALRAYVKMGVSYGYKRILLIVDYLQKVPVYDGMRTFTLEERVERVTSGLKSIALRGTEESGVVAALAVAAADAEGLRIGRVHMENLWGEATTQYDPDVGLIMNKDPLTNEQGVVVRIGLEKNRHGPSDIEFRHRYIGAAYTFAAQGELVAFDDSWQDERKGLRNQQNG